LALVIWFTSYAVHYGGTYLAFDFTWHLSSHLILTDKLTGYFSFVAEMLPFSASNISSVPVSVPGSCSPNLVLGKYNVNVHSD